MTHNSGAGPVRTTALAVFLGAAALIHADQARQRIGPVALPLDDATVENALLATTMSPNDRSESKVYRITHLGPGGWEVGPTAAGLSFWNPQAIAIDGGGRLYVADRDNRRLVRMDDIAGNGWTEFAGTAGNVLAPPVAFSGTYGVARDTAGRLYITSPLDRLVRVDDMAGAGWRTFQLSGSNFFSARDVALDAQGRIYLPDNQKHRIIRIDDISGAGLTTFGSLGTGVGQFKQPYGVTVDAAGRIYIADEDNHRVVRINDMTGQGWTEFGSYGSGPGTFNEPHGLSIDAAGRIWIADPGNQRVVRVNSMLGDGWVSFGSREIQGRGLAFTANKYVRVLGLGPTLLYPSLYPHLVFGNGLRARFVAVNLETSPTDASLRFGRSGSGGCSGDAVDCGSSFSVSVEGVSSESVSRTIPPLGVVGLDATVSGNRTAAYARMWSHASIAAGVLLQSLSGATVTGEAMLPAAPVVDQFIVAVDNRDGAQTAYTITNAAPEGSSSRFGNWGTLTAVVRSADGEVIDGKTISLAPGHQLSEQVAQAFPRTAGADFVGTIEFDSGQSHRQFQAAALRYEGGTLTVFTAMPIITNYRDPAREIQGEHAPLPRDATTTVYWPHVADGDGFRTTFFIVNTSDQRTSTRMEFFNAEGTGLALPLGGVAQTVRTIEIPARGIATVTTDGVSSAAQSGWARVVGSQHIDGFAIVQRRTGGQVSAEAAVPSSVAARHLVTYAVNRGATESGIALSNPNPAAAIATITLRDASGAPLEAATLRIPALGYAAHLGKQLFPGAGDVEGTLEVETSGPPIAAVGLRYDNPGGTVFTTVPVARLP